LKVVLFCHSLLSDWDNDPAHFLRAVLCELSRRGNLAVSYEARDARSVLACSQGRSGRELELELDEHYPELRAGRGGLVRYGAEGPNLEWALDNADLVLVHESTDPALIEAVGQHRVREGRYTLLFYDTSPPSLPRPELWGYDAVLTNGCSLTRLYERLGWGRRVFVWREAVDPFCFRPELRLHPPAGPPAALWTGGSTEPEELARWVLQPLREQGLPATLCGTHLPGSVGHVPQYRLPALYARHGVALHVPRRAYVHDLPGIPSIHLLEAMACGLPVVSAPWEDSDGLFGPGELQVARTPSEMGRLLRELLHDTDLARRLGLACRRTVRARHTVGHRVDDLLALDAVLTRPPRGSLLSPETPTAA
jgi:spore maturation protein CgeB